MSKTMRRIALGVLVFLVVIQFIRPSREVPPLNPGSNFVALNNPPTEIVDLLKSACYDCHSYSTKYPWYANVAPVSWWIGNHIREGREHLNFSTWGKYPFKEQAHKAEEIAEEVGEGHMPEKAYTWMHPEARLTAAQRQQLVEYFTALRAELEFIPPAPLPAPPM